MKSVIIVFCLGTLLSVIAASSVNCSSVPYSTGQLQDDSCECSRGYAWQNGSCVSIPSSSEPLTGDDDDDNDGDNNNQNGGDSNNSQSKGTSVSSGLSDDAKYALIYSLCIGLPALLIGFGLCLIRNHKISKKSQIYRPFPERRRTNAYTISKVQSDKTHNELNYRV